MAVIDGTGYSCLDSARPYAPSRVIRIGRCRLEADRLDIPTVPKVRSIAPSIRSKKKQSTHALAHDHTPLQFSCLFFFPVKPAWFSLSFPLTVSLLLLGKALARAPFKRVGLKLQRPVQRLLPAASKIALQTGPSKGPGAGQPGRRRRPRNLVALGTSRVHFEHSYRSHWTGSVAVVLPRGSRSLPHPGSRLSTLIRTPFPSSRLTPEIVDRRQFNSHYTPSVTTPDKFTCHPKL
ncbi:hypothetical protein B0J13DRAFT_227264 [Dactylonectria estremocensis]|uniref:Uncharacterized protein n=1 Tax=Dactylonectria estremocensis TaxID=1079267 RepID=A0A9P9JCE5_9HYPO|nr:hypothetical protein B0J13DRAFT_227264 [Dactylonectria estremocensis]